MRFVRLRGVLCWLLSDREAHLIVDDGGLPASEPGD